MSAPIPRVSILSAALIAIWSLYAMPIRGQATGNENDWEKVAGGKMSFEVASIRPGDSSRFVRPTFPLNIEDLPIPPGGHFQAGFPLPVYIEFAYKLLLSPEQRESMLAHVPDWVRTQSFVIDAKAPEAVVTKDQIRLMMQSLLSERFGLALHFEEKESAVLAIVLANPGSLGPRLRPHDQGASCGEEWKAPPDATSSTVPPGGFVAKCGLVAVRPGPGNTILWGARDISMDHFALYVPTVYKVGSPVIDQTGLIGTFDFSLDWAPDSNSAVVFQTGESTNVDGPTFIEALKNQLGLKLKSTRSVVRTPIVEHIEPPSPN